MLTSRSPVPRQGLPRSTRTDAPCYLGPVFTTDEALHRAALAAAVASGWPRLQVLRPDEATVLADQALLEAALGPLPQADVVEPGSPLDPDWELDVVLPGLSLDDAARLDADLGDASRSWSVAPSPATLRATHRGVLLGEHIVAGGLVATCTSSALDGLLTADLARTAPLPEALAPLVAPLFERLTAIDPRVGPERAEELLTAAVHRPSGRPGLEVWIPSTAFDRLDGDQVLARRHAIVEAIAAGVSDGPVPLDPHVQWWPRLGGMALWVPLVSPPAPPLHREPPLVDSCTPGPHALAALLHSEGFVHDVELQLVKPDPEAALAALLDAGGEEAIALEPTWVSTIDGPMFLPAWSLPCEPDVVGILGRLRVPWRVVPGVPVGLDDVAPWHDRHAHWGDRRVAVRCRDATADVDREPVTRPRELTAADTALIPVLLNVLGPRAALAGPEAVQPVVGSDGRHGVRIDAGPAAVPHAMALLDALTDLEHPSLACWVDVAFPRRGGVRLHVWVRSPLDGLRAYEPVGAR